MKNYVLSKINKFGIDMKRIVYDFKVEKTNSPTKWIKIVVHHTGKSKKIQQIIDLHVKKNRWSTIGYHFMISKKGTIYYSRSLNYAGAHTFGYNRNAIGIALFGNFDVDEPTEKQIESLNRLIEVLCNEYEIKNILGHNEAIYKKIKERFWKVNLPDLNPIEIKTKLSYDGFVKQITTNILEEDASEASVSLIKRLKSCPGFNMYSHICNLKKKFLK